MIRVIVVGPPWGTTHGWYETVACAVLVMYWVAVAYALLARCKARPLTSQGGEFLAAPLTGAVLVI